MWLNIHFKCYFMKTYTSFLFTLLLVFSLSAQQKDIATLMSAMLLDTPIEEDLQELCDNFGGRVTGTEANKEAVEWGLKKFKEAGVSAEKQAFTIPSLWIENAVIAKVSGDANFKAKIVAKYYSRSTSKEGMTAPIIDVGYGSEKDFAKLGNAVKGKFVLVEQDLCLDIDGFFYEYANSANVDARAAKAGALGVILMASRPQKLLYRFVASDGADHGLFNLVMGREDVKRCQRILRAGGQLNLDLVLDVTTTGTQTSHNVIAEIKGSEKSEEVVIVGAHIDSWGLGTGANDNGCNVAMMIDLARQMKKLGIRPRRTIRFALWNGEEQGIFGSWGYVKRHQDQLDNHVMAMSVDIGSGEIIGFYTNGRPEVAKATEELIKPLHGLGVKAVFDLPLVGTDNFDFMLEGVANLVAWQKPYNYGLYYHSESDTYDKVSLENLKINSAIVAAMVLGYANLPDEKADWKRLTRAEIQKDIIEKHDQEFGMRMLGYWKDWASGKRGRKE